jgi:phosphohistidine phosphatase
MKRILLLRHAKSDWGADGLDDHDRTLAARGERAAGLMGIHLVQQGLRPDLVLCSSARRAQQTWEQMLERLPEPPLIRVEPDLYLAAAGTLFERLRRLEDGVGVAMFVGHNPGMADLAAALAGAGEARQVERVRAKFPTAALALIDADVPSWEDLAPEACRLVAFTTPKDLV